MFVQSLATAAVALASVTSAASIEKRCTQPSYIKPGQSFDRAVTIFFENEDRSTVIADPNFKAWSKKGIYQSNYLAVAHPSQVSLGSI